MKLECEWQKAGSGTKIRPAVNECVKNDGEVLTVQRVCLSLSGLIVQEEQKKRVVRVWRRSCTAGDSRGQYAAFGGSSRLKHRQVWRRSTLRVAPQNGIPIHGQRVLGGQVAVERIVHYSRASCWSEKVERPSRPVDDG